ncbi:MAG TPA: aminoglycoside phosphotransferase family protein [Candidatus Acetothermia bacterium]|nr:aminoglycoside phosphotransferase family protein [Candidatus Acetothermia bacterium]
MFLRAARVLAELHADMHANNILLELPSQRQRLEDKIRSATVLPPDLRRAGLRSLEQMPDGDRLCHGDFHPGNILMTARGPIIIDWIDATRGNPVADVARTWVILSAPRLSIPWFVKVLLSWSHKAYLKRYFQLQSGDQQQFTAWLPIVAGARLSENISEIQDWLLAQVKAGLS